MDKVSADYELQDPFFKHLKVLEDFFQALSIDTKQMMFHNEIHEWIDSLKISIDHVQKRRQDKQVGLYFWISSGIFKRSI